MTSLSKIKQEDFITLMSSSLLFANSTRYIEILDTTLHSEDGSTNKTSFYGNILEIKIKPITYIKTSIIHIQVNRVGQVFIDYIDEQNYITKWFSGCLYYYESLLDILQIDFKLIEQC